MKEKSNFFNIILGVLSLFFIILLFISLLKNLNNSFPFTFSSFLEYISNSPPVFPNFSITDFRILSDWGLFNGLRDFFNFFADCFGFSLFIFSNLVNFCRYVFYFLRYIFAV